MTKRVLVTGAQGFVGSALFERLKNDPAVDAVGSVRSAVPVGTVDAECYRAIGDIGPETNWSTTLTDVDVVVHLAARAHVLNDTNTDPLAEFRRVNVDGALALARQAIAHGIKRFVFISSIGVNGSVTDREAFSERSAPAPHADYARSKYEAEEALKDLVKTSSMELVIIRPPLVYAAHAPGNFRRLLKLVSLGIPMPFGRIDNRRTMIALENLADFIVTCVNHPAAANETFLVGDAEDFSISEMVTLLAKGMQKRPVLLPVPALWLQSAARLSGKQSLYTQLCCSLQVDSSKGHRLLGWTPPVNAQSALVEVGRKYIRG
ncbi:N-acetyl-alpha-D-glucosaminyl-diphospho-ditrans, octacis-undecaprenol 4-epimerase [Pseudomonas fluorescens]|nr:N-acetyl-alpha-D-glucosaminyl-diphospho-ditrans, octacis-undecaprenol 4-epimerase [Pseudomonas fluorescens]